MSQRKNDELQDGNDFKFEIHREQLDCHWARHWTGWHDYIDV